MFRGFPLFCPAGAPFVATAGGGGAASSEGGGGAAIVLRQNRCELKVFASEVSFEDKAPP